MRRASTQQNKKKRGTQYMGELVLKIYFNGNHLSEGGYATKYICTVYISVVMLYGVREYGSA